MRVDGCAVLRAGYAAFGRFAENVFVFATLDGHAPTAEELGDLAFNYGVWEQDIAGIGYSTLRSSDSQFVGCRVNSIDSRHQTFHIDGPVSVAGLIPSFVFGMLPSNLSPIIRWATAEKGLATGRTYAVGITTAATKGNSDGAELNGLYRDALATIYGDLAPTVAAPVGYKMVHLVRAVKRGPVLGPSALDITGLGVYVRCGTQRRRLRPGLPD